MGGSEKELKLNSSCELLVSFVCRKGENIANFGSGSHNTSACKTYDPVNYGRSALVHERIPASYPVGNPGSFP